MIGTDNCPYFLDGIPFANVCVTWQGWETNLAKLYHAGWEVNTKSRFQRLTNSSRMWYKGQYIYLINKKECMVARLTIALGDASGDGYGTAYLMFDLDFMVNRKLVKQTPNRIKCDGFDKDDIEPLLSIIQELQAQYPQVEREPLPVAQVLDITKFLQVA